MSGRGPPASGPAQAEPSQLPALPAADTGRPAAPITGDDSSAPVRSRPGRQPAWPMMPTASSPPPGLNAGAHSQQRPHPGGRHRETRPRAVTGARGPELGAGEERWSYGTRDARRAELRCHAHRRPHGPRKPGPARAAQGPWGRRRDDPAATSARVHLRLASGRSCRFGLPISRGLARSAGAWEDGGGGASPGSTPGMHLTSTPSSRPGRRDGGLLLPGTRPRPGREKAWTLPRAGSD